ncbi:MAG: type VI secretion system tube protein Hcp [Pseudomonadota bacterium]
MPQDAHMGDILTGGTGLTAFLELPDIPGEATRSGHEEQIEINSFQWSHINRGAAKIGSGQTRGSVEAGPVLLGKFMDKSSPYIWQSCCSGKSFDGVKIYFQKATGDGYMDYVTIELNECIITRYDIVTDMEQQLNREIIGFDAGHIIFCYETQESDHSAGGPEETEWNYGKGE